MVIMIVSHANVPLQNAADFSRSLNTSGDESTRPKRHGEYHLRFAKYYQVGFTTLKYLFCNSSKTRRLLSVGNTDLLETRHRTKGSSSIGSNLESYDQIDAPLRTHNADKFPMLPSRNDDYVKWGVREEWIVAERPSRFARLGGSPLSELFRLGEMGNYALFLARPAFLFKENPLARLWCGTSERVT